MSFFISSKLVNKLHIKYISNIKILFDGILKRGNF